MVVHLILYTAGEPEMFDPVWLGNYIVPRWEAIALLLGTVATSLFVAVFIGGLIYSGVAILVKRMNG
jgi:hypothetical protein